MHKFRLVHTVILSTAFLSILTTTCHAAEIFAVVSNTDRDIEIINLDKFAWTDVTVTLNEGGIFSPGYS